MNEYIVTVHTRGPAEDDPAPRSYRGYHRTFANAIFGALRADENAGYLDKAFHTPTGPGKVTVEATLIAARVRRSTTGTKVLR